jgi:hypothetical protein
MLLQKYKNQIINSLLISKFFHFKYSYDISELQQIKIIFFFKNLAHKKKIKKYKNKKKFKFLSVQQELFLCSNLFYITKQKPIIKKKKYLSLNIKKKKKKNFFFYKQYLQLNLNKKNSYNFISFFSNILLYEKLQNKIYKQNLIFEFHGFTLQNKKLLTKKKIHIYFIKFLFLNKFFGFNFLYNKLQINLKEELLWLLNQKYLTKNNYLKLFFTKNDLKLNIFILQLLHLPIQHEIYFK